MPFLLLFSVFLIAACGLIYELLAGTLASYLLGDSVFQFSTVIGAYLFAMGIGSYLSKFIGRGLVSRFVTVELMMPFVPFVRCRDIDHGIELAQKYEHGYRHTSIIHSRDVHNMTKMARAMDTTLFVKNGPCMAALGLGGEGYLSFSIAGPTGEGVTTPMTFTRERRCSLIDDLWVLGGKVS